jgi:hypothetical protein
MNNSNEEERTILTTAYMVVALTAFITVFGAALAFHYLR